MLKLPSDLLETPLEPSSLEAPHLLGMLHVAVYISRDADRVIHRMSEEEHEMRSVFVSQLSARVGDRELFQFFETTVGKVRDARVILDRVSRRSKG